MFRSTVVDEKLSCRLWVTLCTTSTRYIDRHITHATSARRSLSTCDNVAMVEEYNTMQWNGVHDTDREGVVRAGGIPRWRPVLWWCWRVPGSRRACGTGPVRRRTSLICRWRGTWTRSHFRHCTAPNRPRLHRTVHITCKSFANFCKLLQHFILHVLRS